MNPQVQQWIPLFAPLVTILTTVVAIVFAAWTNQRTTAAQFAMVRAALDGWVGADAQAA